MWAVFSNTQIQIMNSGCLVAVGDADLSGIHQNLVAFFHWIKFANVKTSGFIIVFQ